MSERTEAATVGPISILHRFEWTREAQSYPCSTPLPRTIAASPSSSTSAFVSNPLRIHPD
jgi:hypothetical protein